jgi:hypothetical protein
MTLGVKEAVAKAVGYFQEFYGEEFQSPTLEEVERHGDYWCITLGYDLPSIIPQFHGNGPRAYKTFKIDGSDS